MNYKFENIDENNWHLFVDESGTKDYKRLIKLKDQNKWSNFQPDPHPQNVNLFSLIGLLIYGKNLTNEFIPSVKRIKYELYQNKNIVFHLSDMLSAKNEFSKYKDNPNLFKSHLEKIIVSIKNIPFYIFIVHIDKVSMLNTYSQPAEPYELAPTIIMERIGYFFYKNNYLKKTLKPIINVWFESRSKKDDINLKQHMVNELILTEKELFNKTKFPRYPNPIKNIRSIEWHMHGLPKNPNELVEKEYYSYKYSYETGVNLIHGLHIADIIISAYRRYRERERYPNIKFLEVEPIVNLIEKNKKKFCELFFP